MGLGPVQLMVVGFDHPDFHGEIIAELARLQEADVVRVVDALVVDKGDDGSVATIQLSGLSVEEAEEIGAIAGALIGLGAAGEEGAEVGAALGALAAADGHLLDDLDLVEVLEEIPEGTAAAVVLLEHRWAIGLRDAIGRTGGAPILDMWVHPLDLVAVGLDAADD